MIARTLIGQNNKQKAFQQLILKVCRSSSTLTSTISSPHTTPYAEANATLSFNDLRNNEKRNDDSTDKLRDDISSTSLALRVPDTSTQRTISSDFHTFGVQVHPFEAASIAKTDNVVDKILIFISHGETVTPEENGESEINLKLTGKGIGHALSISREAHAYCNKNTGLVPDLYVTSPNRCTTESALLAFPYNAPGNVQSKPWICHDKCIDTNLDKSSVDSILEDFEFSFPGVDYGLLRENANTSSESFLSWIAKRNERIIVVSSSESWVDEFVSTYAPGKTSDEKSENNRYLRAVCLNFN